jgi:peptidyl-prolyl cis-trans isomerase SurA
MFMMRVSAWACALLMLFALSVVTDSAQAQGTVATVNGEPISSADVDQRMRIDRLMFRQNLSRAQTIDTLINDKIKIAEGRRLGMRVTNEFLDDSLGRMASGNRMTRAEFQTNLSRAGVNIESLRDRLRAEAVWSEILRSRSRAGGASNAEIDAELQRRLARGEAKVTDYVLRQVIFVVTPDNGVGAQERQAAAARQRFTDCETGVDYLRTLRDVAVRERVSRSSAEVSEQLAQLLARTQTGRLTPTFRSDQGVEMLAVCERFERQDTGALRSRVEEELSRRRAEGSGEAFLRELRSRAEIVRR